MYAFNRDEAVRAFRDREHWYAAVERLARPVKEW
jgi:hypothetical protein